MPGMPNNAGLFSRTTFTGFCLFSCLIVMLHMPNCSSTVLLYAFTMMLLFFTASSFYILVLGNKIKKQRIIA